MIVGSTGGVEPINDLRFALNWAGTWDMFLILGKGHLLLRSTKGLTVSQDQGLFAVNAVNRVKNLGMTVTSDFKWTRQCTAATQKATELFRLKLAFSCLKSEVFIPLYKTMARPHLKYCVQPWHPLFKKDYGCFEPVQRLGIRMVEGLSIKSYDQLLYDLDFSLDRNRHQGDLLETFRNAICL